MREKILAYSKDFEPILGRERANAFLFDIADSVASENQTAAARTAVIRQSAPSTSQSVAQQTAPGMLAVANSSISPGVFVNYRGVDAPRLADAKLGYPATHFAAYRDGNLLYLTKHIDLAQAQLDTLGTTDSLGHFYLGTAGRIVRSRSTIIADTGQLEEGWVLFQYLGDWLLKPASTSQQYVSVSINIQAPSY